MLVPFILRSLTSVGMFPGISVMVMLFPRKHVTKPYHVFVHLYLVATKLTFSIIIVMVMYKPEIIIIPNQHGLKLSAQSHIHDYFLPQFIEQLILHKMI